MEIYLTSTKHGKKIAHADIEADLDCSNGWLRCTKDEYFGTSKEADVESVKETPIQAPITQNVANFGSASKKKGNRNKLNR